MGFSNRVTVLGSTGSIGTQTLKVAREHDEIEIVGLSAQSNIALLEEQIREFKPKIACVVNQDKAKELKIKVADTNTKIVSGTEGMTETACIEDADTALVAVVGISGLLPTIEAIKSGKNIALANKETLVTGGHIVTKLVKDYGVKLLPVDSEHSAIFQSLQASSNKSELKRILLTASGGPFFGKSRDELKNVKPKDALNHPNWDMGAKVTIDSSTLVNKGLEVIEAKWLFDVPIDKIDVLVHRQSIVHSMVEYIDNAVIAQLGVPDMCLPIQYALTYPKRLSMSGESLDFTKYSELTFAKPDTDTFYALKLAYNAGKKGGIMPCIFNSADEVAVDMFLKEKIGYLDIADTIEYAMSEIKNIDNPNIEQILQADKTAREKAVEFASRK